MEAAAVSKIVRIPKGLFRPLKYLISLIPRLEEEAFDGEMTLNFEALSTVSGIFLHMKDLQVIQVSFCNQQEEKWEEGKFSQDDSFFDTFKFCYKDERPFLQ